VLAAAALTTLIVYRDSDGDPAVLGFWAFTATVLLWSVLAHVGTRGRYRHLPVAPGRVLAVIPAYNETTAAVHATVHAILRQTIACDIVVVDDGSVTPVQAFPHPRVRWAPCTAPTAVTTTSCSPSTRTANRTRMRSNISCGP
jgi:hyaluronan synthase